MAVSAPCGLNGRLTDMRPEWSFDGHAASMVVSAPCGLNGRLTDMRPQWLSEGHAAAMAVKGTCGLNGRPSAMRAEWSSQRHGIKRIEQFDSKGILLGPKGLVIVTEPRRGWLGWWLSDLPAGLYLI